MKLNLKFILAILLCFCFVFAGCNGIKYEYTFLKISYLDGEIEYDYSGEQVKEMNYNANLPDDATLKQKSENYIAMIKEIVDIKYDFYNNGEVKVVNLLDDSVISVQKWAEEEGKFVVYQDETHTIDWVKFDGGIYFQSVMGDCVIRAYLQLKK